MTDGAPQEYKETVGSCSACGNSPVNHFGAYCAYTMSIWAANAHAAIARMPLVRDLTVPALVDADRVMHLFCALGFRVGFVRFSRDPKKASTYRSQVVWEEALARGIDMEQLVLFGMHADTYRAHLGGRWIYFESIPVPPHLASSDSLWIDDKFLLKRTLRAEGIPAARAVSVRSRREALAAFEEIGAPVVVKPRAGSRGRHTTTNVRTREELLAAFSLAQKLCRYVVVEEYLSGFVCRGTVIGGKLAGFFEAGAPRVVGDGVSTIVQLIAARNATRPDRVQEIRMGDEHERFLARQGYAIDSIPPRDAIVPLTHRTGRLFGGETRELLSSVHPKLREYLERAARVIEVPVVGFDLIIEDPEADPDTQKWGIIEGNGLPYIDLHYLPLKGMPSNTASAVWDLWGAAAARQ